MGIQTDGMMFFVLEKLILHNANDTNVATMTAFGK